MIIDPYSQKADVTPGTRTWMSSGSSASTSITNGGRSVAKTSNIGGWDIMAYAGVSGVASNLYGATGYLELVISGAGGQQIGIIQSAAAVSSQYLGINSSSRRIEVNAVGGNYSVETGYDGSVVTSSTLSGWTVGSVLTWSFSPSATNVYLDGAFVMSTGWGTTVLGVTNTYLAVASAEAATIHVRAAVDVDYPLDGISYLFP